jgi:long-chain acyl-CoA synthetase
MGDIGWLDEEGFLYLTDRKSFMIISGGVNVYPQEIENLLLTHAGVADAAVFGAPDPDLGEKPRDRDAANQGFAEELHTYLRSNLSRVKSPKRIDFMYELPRLPTGKLMKRLLQDAYRGENADLMREIVPGK